MAMVVVMVPRPVIVSVSVIVAMTMLVGMMVVVAMVVGVILGVLVTMVMMMVVLMPMIMGMRMPVGVPLGLVGIGSFDRTPVEEDAEAGAGEAAAHGFAALHRHPRKTEPSDRVRDHVEGHAKVQAGPEEHVSREAARAVEVVVRHGGEGYHAGLFPRPPYQAILSRMETQRPAPARMR